jgi:hypothetical protein
MQAHLFLGEALMELGADLADSVSHLTKVNAALAPAAYRACSPGAAQECPASMISGCHAE